MRRIAWLLPTLLMISISPVEASPKIAAGSPCYKQGEKISHEGKKYTCIKSGQKLVWDKGSTSRDSKQKSSQIDFPKEDSICVKPGMKITGNNGFMKCTWLGGPTDDLLKNMKWRYYPIHKVSSSRSNNYATTPKQNARCEN